MSVERVEEVEFHRGLRDIQSELRRYDPDSVMLESLKYLYAPAKNKTEKISRQPWLVMLLLKWAYLDPLANSLLPRPGISKDRLLSILQKVLNLSDSGRMPFDYADVRLFMRALAYQQFFYQKDDQFSDLARQELIFAEVPDNHYFKVNFEKGVGLSVEVFIRLSMALIVHIGNYGFCLSRADLFALCPPYTPFEIDAFLRAVSVESSQLQRFLIEVEKEASGSEEFLRQTPFLQRPLIKHGPYYFCVSTHVLQRSLGHYIYDYLKRDDVNGFNNPFGKAFEKYVGRFLEKTGLPLVSERELIKFLPGTGGVVDFLVADGNSNILIDAKGVEMGLRGMVSVTQGDIRKATKTSLIKAFEQAHEVVSRIPETSKHSIVRRGVCNYLLVVTYKELYVGNGVMLEGVVGVDVLDKIRKSYAEEFIVPLENMYFLTIHEFEVLTTVVANGKIGFVEAIERAKKADAQPATQNFNFELHLRSWRDLIGPEVPLLDVLKGMVEGMAALVPRSEAVEGE